MKKRTGRCQCGEVCYESVGEPITLYICHCWECQKQSASAFGISLEVSQTSFRITQGVPKYWSRKTDSGRQLKCAFCPTCGSRLWHEYDPPAETLSIKGGSLDNMTLQQEKEHQRQQKEMVALSNESEYKLIQGDHNVFFTPNGHQIAVAFIG
jgi:hypothetical protein